MVEKINFRSWTDYDVAVGDITFNPHHTWDDDTDWIDGQLIGSDGEGQKLQLDIGSTLHRNDGCMSMDDSRSAETLWVIGKVYSYRPFPNCPITLLIPDRLTRENVTKALQRFQP